MTKRELLKLLENISMDTEIIMQGDPEGNFFNRIRGIAVGVLFHEIARDQGYSLPEIDPHGNEVAIMYPAQKIYP